MFQKGCVLQCKIDSLFKNRVNYNSKLVIFQKHCVLQWIIDVFRGAKNIVKHSTFEMCRLKTMYFTMNLEDSENQSWKWSQFDWFSKKLKNIWFFIFFWSKKQFLLTVLQKCTQNGPGLDSGWVGLAGLGRAGWLGQGSDYTVRWGLKGRSVGAASFRQVAPLRIQHTGGRNRRM